MLCLKIIRDTFYIILNYSVKINLYKFFSNINYFHIWGLGIGDW